MMSDKNLKGLVLCGGRSKRMQQDKSNIGYHGVPQWQHLRDLLQSFLPEVWLSCRADQEFPGSNVITDSFESAGPATGLLSAHVAQPETSWLVLACDLPLISAQSVEYLIAHRQPEKAATAFLSDFNQSPEPLIAIWEPAALEKLAAEVKEGLYCPRKTLQKSDVLILENPYSIEQFNANTPEEMQDALRKIK